MLNIRHLVGSILLLHNGLTKILAESKDFYELEKGISELSQKVSSQMLIWTLEQLDLNLMNSRDRETWEVIGFREKQVVSTLGEFTYKRRLYRNTKTGETKFFLDELLGFPSHAKITPRLREIAVKLSTEMSFRRAADILSQLFPTMSFMTVWKAKEEIGIEIQQDSEEKRKAVFERGESPKGEKEAKVVNIEGDGVIVNLQRAEKKKGEIKHLVAYEGKREIKKGRKELENKVVISGMREWPVMWEETYAKTGEIWAINRIEEINIGGDGEKGVKQGLEYFPGARYRLDPYHLSKNLIEALWYDEETYSKVCEAIHEGNFEDTQEILKEAAVRTRGERKKRVLKLLGYLKDNWEGIVNSPGAERLGTIEGQIQHNVARRMKRRGARWSESGADRMVRILAEKANGKLEEYAMRWPMKQKKIKEIVTEIAQTKEKKKAKVEDIEKWLKVSLPILNGPYASKPWIKYVLKELSRPNFSAMI
jgi:hypothetical protein